MQSMNLRHFSLTNMPEDEICNCTLWTYSKHLIRADFYKNKILRKGISNMPSEMNESKALS